MPTLAESDDFQQALDDVRTLMVAELVEQWAASRGSSSSIADLRDFVTSLVAEYGQASAAVAIDFYESVRPPGAPAFSPVPAVRDDLIPGPTLEWMVQTIADDYETTLDRMAAAAQKAAFEAVIETIGEATVEDPIEVKYARFPQNDDPCAYCVFRASRGAVYYTETSATRGDHTACKCRVIPVFSDEVLPYRRAPLIGQYQAGLKEAEGPGLKAILAGMRRANGLR